MTRLLTILCFITVFATSCSEYQKVLKTTDLNVKYEKALEYYEDEEYARALPLFEELTIIYRGTPKAEKLNFLYANCDYYMGDLLLASFRFKNFAKTFPLSQYAEESLFMSAYCNYLNSPKASLDQTPTYSAIEDLKLFSKLYPTSERLDSCNVLLDDLRIKLEVKSFDIAYQYYHMRNYKSAIVAFNNLLKDYPGTEYTEKALYYTLSSNYLLAMNSVTSKKEERLEDTIKSYVKFVDSFPTSKKIKEAENIYNDALKEKEKNKTAQDGLQKNKRS